MLITILLEFIKLIVKSVFKRLHLIVLWMSRQLSRKNLHHMEITYTMFLFQITHDRIKQGNVRHSIFEVFVYLVFISTTFDVSEGPPRRAL